MEEKAEEIINPGDYLRWYIEHTPSASIKHLSLEYGVPMSTLSEVANNKRYITKKVAMQLNKINPDMAMQVLKRQQSLDIQKLKTQPKTGLYFGKYNKEGGKIDKIISVVRDVIKKEKKPIIDIQTTHIIIDKLNGSIKNGLFSQIADVDLKEAIPSDVIKAIEKERKIRTSGLINLNEEGALDFIQKRYGDEKFCIVDNDKPDYRHGLIYELKGTGNMTLKTEYPNSYKKAGNICINGENEIDSIDIIICTKNNKKPNKVFSTDQIGKTRDGEVRPNRPSMYDNTWIREKAKSYLNDIDIDKIYDIEVPTIYPPNEGVYAIKPLQIKERDGNVIVLIGYASHTTEHADKMEFTILDQHIALSETLNDEMF